LLARRLALAACVCFIPQTSLYLPLALFSFIQISALLQHYNQPYRYRWLNRAELCSLYLLLLNYISALVSEGAHADNVSDSSDATWVAVLFICNLVFLLALTGGLFAYVRAVASLRGHEILVKLKQLRACCFDSNGRPTRRARQRKQLEAANKTAESNHAAALAGSSAPTSVTEEPHPVAGPELSDAARLTFDESGEGTLPLPASQSSASGRKRSLAAVSANNPHLAQMTEVLL
jgi:hypothetical protein